MHTNPHLHLISIYEQPILFPDATGICSGLHQIQLNSTGSFLWKNVNECESIDALIKKATDYYKIDPFNESSQFIALTGDINAFVEQLTKVSAIISDEEYNKIASSLAVIQSYSDYCTKFIGADHIYSAPYSTDSVDNFYSQAIQIAGVNIALASSQSNKYLIEQLVRTYFSKFNSIEGTVYSPDLYITFKTIEKNDQKFGGSIISAIKSENRPIIFGQGISVYKLSDCYIVLFDTFKGISHVILNADTSKAVYYMYSDIDSANVNFSNADLNEPTYQSCESSNSYIENVFLSMRFFFMLSAATQEKYLLHSASILYNGRAYLFSAPSGTGKSTHVNLWKKLWGTPIINGDINLIGFDKASGHYMIYGTPWCGTSGIYDSEMHTLGGIIFLQRGIEPTVKEIAPLEKTLAAANRILSPVLSVTALKKETDFLQKMIDNKSNILIPVLLADQSDKSAIAIRTYIDDASIM